MLMKSDVLMNWCAFASNEKILLLASVRCRQVLSLVLLRNIFIRMLEFRKSKIVVPRLCASNLSMLAVCNLLSKRKMRR
jgi:hypothetical protein